MELLEAGGLPLGAFDFSDYSEATVPFNQGDSLLMYTDGLTETFDADDNDFGENRLMDFLRENQQLSADQIVSGLRTAIQKFSGKEQADDDVTIVVLQAASEAVMEGR
jgi:serine phosphatase RsbU (regulator of sigma subunit)